MKTRYWTSLRGKVWDIQSRTFIYSRKPSKYQWCNSTWVDMIVCKHTRMLADLSLAWTLRFPITKTKITLSIRKEIGNIEHVSRILCCFICMQRLTWEIYLVLADMWRGRGLFSSYEWKWNVSRLKCKSIRLNHADHYFHRHRQRGFEDAVLLQECHGSNQCLWLSRQHSP